MNSENVIDIEEWREEVDRMKEEYYQETGEELPDHVIENIRLLSTTGPTWKDLREARKEGKERAEKEYTWRHVTAVSTLFGVVLGGIGYAAGPGLGSNFGVPVIALVSAAFGFVVAALIAEA